MSIKVYYFSGTGNSYIVGKTIARRLNAELLSIPKAMKNEKIEIDAESIGIVFPSYIAPLLGVPLIVERFIKRINNIASIRIFTICTCGGYECVNALPSLRKLKQIIESCGGILSDEYSVRLPMNNLDYDHIPIPIVRDSGVIINKSKNKIDQICERIISNKGTKYELAKRLFYLVMLPLYKMMQKSIIDDLREKAKVPIGSTLQYFELVPLTDQSITVDNKCTACGTCTRICPVNNIKIVNKRPEFKNKCEMCFACDEWCPSNAIHHWSRKEGVKYHHPEVKLKEMI